MALAQRRSAAPEGPVAAAGWVAIGLLVIAVGAVAAPVALGLLSAAVIHTVRPSEGRVPVIALLAVHALDIALLVAVGMGARTAWQRAGAHRTRW